MEMSERPILTPPNGDNNVLMHSCCAPCAGELMEAMVASGINMTIFFYNPNIHPLKEYELRKQENIRYAEKMNIPFIDADYEVQDWFRRVKGMEYEPERGRALAPLASICVLNALRFTPMNTVLIPLPAA